MILQEKTKCPEHLKKSRQTTLVSMANILCLAIMVKESCASTIFNSILKGNLKVLGNKKMRKFAEAFVPKK